MAQKKTAKRGGRKTTTKSAARTIGKRTAGKRATSKRTSKASRSAKRTPLVGTLGMITLHVHDIKRAVAFYGDALGLRKLQVIDTPEFGWAEFEVAPRLKLGIHADPGKTEDGARAPGGASGFYFAVPDVDATIAKLRAKGVKIVDEPTDRSYGRDAYVADPDGNEIAVLTPS